MSVESSFRTQLKDGAIDTALATLDALEPVERQASRYQQPLIRTLLRLGKVADACAHAQALAAQDPANLSVLALLVDCLRRQDDAAGIERHLLKTVSSTGATAQSWHDLYRDTSAFVPVDVAANAWVRFAQSLDFHKLSDGDAAALAMICSKATLAAARTDDALAWLDHIKHTPYDGHAATASIRASIFYAQSEYQRGLQFVQAARKAHPQSFSLAMAEIDFLKQFDRPNALRRAYVQAGRSRPNAAGLLRRLRRECLPRRDLRQIFNTIVESRALSDETPGPEGELFSLALQLGDDRFVSSARARGTAPKHLTALLDNGLLFKSRRFVDDPGKEVQVVAHPDAFGTLIVFPGIESRFGGIPLQYVDAFWGLWPLNVIYLRNKSGWTLLGGHRTLGADEAQIVGGLGDVIERLGGGPVLTTGFSAGGYQAIRLGAMLGADAAIGFSAPSFIPTRANGTLDMSHIEERVRIYTAALRPEQLDLRPALERAPSMTAHLIVGTYNRVDMRHCERLMDLPNVTRHGLASSGHGLLLRSIETGLLSELMDGLTAGLRTRSQSH